MHRYKRQQQFLLELLQLLNDRGMNKLCAVDATRVFQNLSHFPPQNEMKWLLSRVLMI